MRYTHLNGAHSKHLLWGLLHATRTSAEHTRKKNEASYALHASQRSTLNNSIWGLLRARRTSAEHTLP